MDAGNDDPFGEGDGFHRNEAISAVQDEEDQFLGEEDYEDYDDLYNDVNVGEGFLHSVPPPSKGPTFPVKQGEALPLAVENTPPQPLLPQMPRPPLLPPATANVPVQGGVAEVKVERAEAMASVQVFSSAGYRSPAVGVRPETAQFGPKPGEAAAQFGNPNPAFGNDGFPRPGSGGFVPGGGGGNASVGGPPNYAVNVNGGSGGAGITVAGGGAGITVTGGGGGTTLFVGDLLWWTTDTDLESELCKYGQVKEVRFYDEKASGKSKGYAQVDFYDPIAASACKEGMDGHVFNGKPCVVAFASPFNIRRMGEAQLNKNQGMNNQSQSTPAVQGMRGRGGNGIPTGGNYGARGGGGNWGRGGGGVGGRGNMGAIRNRMGPAGGRGIMGNGGMVNPPPPPVMHPGAMLGQGFDPTSYGMAMGRMGGFGGFPGGPAAPFPGMMPTYPPMVAPHVNPAFFGRGMAPGGVGMWQDPNAGMWGGGGGGEEQSNYGEDAASDHQYGEGSHGKDRVSDRDWSGAPDRKSRDEREKDMGTGQDWSERRPYDDRDVGREKERERDRDRDREKDRDRERDRERGDRYRDERDRYGDRDQYRHREREVERDDRGRSSSTRSRSREFEHSKRRRLTPE